MPSYLFLADFSTRSILPVADTAAVEAARPGFINLRLATWTSKVEARLRKRYAVPFADPVPETVLDWIVTLATPDVFRARGYNPKSEQDQQIQAAADLAWKEVLEAANSEDGLFDLPLLETSPSTSAIVEGGPYGYSERSPYHWTDVEAEVIRGG